MLLTLPAKVRDKIIQHSVSALPREAVGLLAGRENSVHIGMELKNIARKGAFLVDPYDQFRAERELSLRGLAILAVYHSHPDGCSCLSELDIMFAKNWHCAHIVVSLNTFARRARLCGYRLSASQPAKVDIKYLDGNSGDTGPSESGFSW